MGTGMDDWVQVLLGKKYSPNQPRDASGRFGSGGGISSSFSPELEKRLQTTERQNMHLKQERVSLFDKNGETLYHGYGTENTAAIPRNLVDNGKLEGAVLTHNHPRGSSFSFEDVDLAARANLKEVRAAGVSELDGKQYVYRMRPGKKGWPNRETLRVIYSDFDYTQRNDWWRKLDRGELSEKEANATHNHELWKKVADNFGMNYSREVVG